jgi:hypothetical protein
MRPLLIAAAVLALPTALQAQPRSNAPVSDSLPSPQTIDRTGAALDRMIDGLLEIDVAPLANAIDPNSPYARGHQTIGDMARRDDPYFDEKMHRSVGAISDNMINMTRTMRRLEPVLRDSLKDVVRDVEDAMRDVPNDRYQRNYYDRGY